MIFIYFQKLLEVEDLVEDERKDLSSKIESLESLVRMLELKAKNSTDHGKSDRNFVSAGVRTLSSLALKPLNHERRLLWPILT